jgi:hypothetical protein
MGSRTLGIVGVILVLLGLVWILQGTNVLPGLSMSGQHLYALLGAVVAIIGAVMASAVPALESIGAGERSL